MPILTATSMLTVLLIGLSLALAELFDQVFNKITPQNKDYIFFGYWILMACNWLFWGVLLWSKGKQWPRMKTMSRLTGLIFAGSLAELLAAVPSHIIVSKRPGCVVGILTMLGIIAGLFVMVFSFGPGIAVLFLRPRYRREQMEASPICMECSYDLRGSLAAGSMNCPECGWVIPETVKANSDFACD